MNEYIICSAIHVEDGNQYEHQPKNIDTGFVVAGRRHHNCYLTLSLMGEEKYKLMVGRKGQGFITNKDRYVNRIEGMKIAKSARQLINPALHEDNEDAILTSEDLY